MGETNYIKTKKTAILLIETLLFMEHGALVDFSTNFLRKITEEALKQDQKLLEYFLEVTHSNFPFS